MKNFDRKNNVEQLSEDEIYHIKRDKRNDFIVKIMNRIIIGTILILTFIYFI